MAKAEKKAKTKADPMAEMRKRFEECYDADRDQRDLAIEDWEFVNIPGEQWDSHMKTLRKGRPCYEFSILRSHWRQINNDQKKARPSIKVRPVENGDMKGAQLRQGLIRNIEQVSNADHAYDSAMETVSASGFGAWLVRTDYSNDDGWDQDICIDRIDDPLNSVWLDYNNLDDPSYGFILKDYTREGFKAAFPDAEAVSFEAANQSGMGSWFGEDMVRVVSYYRIETYDKTIILLSDGRSMERTADTDALMDEWATQGITVERERKAKGRKVIMSVCSGAEEIDGPYELAFDRIPIIGIWANRFKHEGKWYYCGMVRFSRDPQKLVNYNLTTAMETIGKAPKSPYLVTPEMLSGKGVAERWANAGATDPFFLPYTPDAKAPGGRPAREPAPEVPAALLQLASTSVDMLKATDGIFDASVGARSNETSGRAILARQQEGDTATFDYQDSVSKGIRKCGEIILKALPSIYDTPRVVRIIGNDGTEKMEELYKVEIDAQTGRQIKANDLSMGKYDLTVSTGPSYDTMRMEFFDTMSNLAQSNPMIAQAVPDLMMKALDFPGAEEAAERLKMLLPPPIQQKLAEGKELPPEAAMALQQAQQMMQQAQQQMQAIQQAAAELDQSKAATDAEKQQIQADKALMDANYKRMQAELKAATLEAEASLHSQSMQLDQRETDVGDAEQSNAEDNAVLQTANAVVEQVAMLTQQQGELMAQIGALVAQSATAPKVKEIEIVRDESGRAIGARSVEVAQ